MSAIGRSGPHESAQLHVSGAARYTDDLPEPADLIHGAVVMSPIAHGRLLGIDTNAAKAAPGVRAVLTAADIPGDPMIGAIVHDEPLMAVDEVHCIGQVVGVVFADTHAQAKRAAALVELDLSPLPHIVGIDKAIADSSFHTPAHTIARGDVVAALDTAAVTLTGEMRSGAQNHFYLETQAALVIPAEAGGLDVWSSTQHPTEIQRMVARVVGKGDHQIRCEVPRVGGGFGGKESQATAWACLAALGVHHTGRPAKVRLDRDTDALATGNRHPFLGRWRAGFDPQGTLLALEVDLFSDGGWSIDLSGPVLDRGLFHLDNAYYIDALRFTGRVCRTHTASNTAFRGFGGPQGMLVVEDALNSAAEHLGLDPAGVRRRNYYVPGRDHAPYGQHVPTPRAERIHKTLLETASVADRQRDIARFNVDNENLKRGLGFQPLKFGISFTKALLNQAGALVHVYADGTVQVNHGGVEMGQGLHTKMRAVAAHGFGIPEADVRIMHTNTDKVPNTSATAASSGSDLNGAAVQVAVDILIERMAPVRARLQVELGRPPDFKALALQCWLQRIGLSATGFYATPGIEYNPDTGRGTPFFYYAWGGAWTEVELCCWTGEYRVRRIDILHDVGDSLTPDIDRGQIEGAYAQGLGWLTMEEHLINHEGRPLTLGPSTYKVPAIGDLPVDFRVDLLDHASQPGVIGGSKAVGEPPFMLAISAISAMRQAIRTLGPGRVELALPATPEAVLRAISRQRSPV
jgi:xanthine dehydrogenase large subunit